VKQHAAHCCSFHWWRSDGSSFLPHTHYVTAPFFCGVGALPRRLPPLHDATVSGQGLRGCIPCTVLIVDHSALIRHALRSSIEQTGDWQVCGEAENGKVAVERVKQLHPDVVILDLQMPFMDGLEVARQINLLAPNTAMLMFTMQNCERLLEYAPAAEIRDVLSKSDGLAEHLLACLKSLQAEHQVCA